MDAFTRRHLMDWLDNEMPDWDHDLCEQMVRTYESDPDYYGRNGWWACYDDLARNVT